MESLEKAGFELVATVSAYQTGPEPEAGDVHVYGTDSMQVWRKKKIETVVEFGDAGYCVTHCEDVGKGFRALLGFCSPSLIANRKFKVIEL
jgi:hypothetical protein